MVDQKETAVAADLAKREDQGQTDEAEEVDELDFEVTLASRRDAASDAGSDDEDQESEEGFVTGGGYYCLIRMIGTSCCCDVAHVICGFRTDPDATDMHACGCSSQHSRFARQSHLRADSSHQLFPTGSLGACSQYVLHCDCRTPLCWQEALVSLRELR